MPYEKYQEHAFNAKSRALINFANEVIADYAPQGLILTLRQLYYRFVAHGKIPNTQQSYDSLGALINNARLAGLIDWAAIEDRTRGLQGRAHATTPLAYGISMAERYTIDLWVGQQTRLEIWVEKEALIGVIGRVALEFDVPFLACRGYLSQSEMWEASKRMHDYYRRSGGGIPVVLHMGDHDPSGIDMTRDNEDRLSDLFKCPVRMKRIALNMSQIQRYDPPPNPAKVTDSRYKGYLEEYGSDSWEMDALEPRVLKTIVQGHIEQYLDMAKFNKRVEKQKAEREWLKNKITAK